jgi:pentapeptide MXKDX repeat protein
MKMKKLFAAVFAAMFGLGTVSVFAADEMNKEDTRMEKPAPRKVKKAAKKHVMKKHAMEKEEMKKEEMRKDDMKRDEMKRDEMKK